MKNKLLIMVFVIFCNYLSYSQQDNNIINETNHYQSFIQKKLSSINFSSIQQLGAGNIITIFQIQQGIISNSFITIQEGFDNVSYIEQVGKSHISHLHQDGNNNEANLWSLGKHIKTDIAQIGSNNSIFSNLSNNTSQLYSAVLQQTGKGNNIELTLLGNNVVPDIDRIVSVTQTGNNLTFTATGDFPEQPVNVEQTSGPTGTGMSVTISTSAFYFPMKQ